MKEIRLIGKYSADMMLVDDEIYNEMNTVQWYGLLKRGRLTYANHTTRPFGYQGKTVTLLAHRRAALLYGILKSLYDPLLIDHINHNGLDNRRCNLRAVTHEENQRNQSKTKRKTSSRFKGVSWHKKDKCWRVSINAYRGEYLGSFDSEIAAAKAYDAYARSLGYLDSALNFPGGASYGAY
jgi:hypothetical protein